MNFDPAPFTLYRGHFVIFDSEKNSEKRTLPREWHALNGSEA